MDAAQVSIDDDGKRLTLSGVLGVPQAAALLAAVKDHIDRLVAVDCAAAEVLHTAALQVLVAAARHSLDRGVRLRLVGIAGAVAEQIELTGAARFFDLEPGG